MKKFMLAFATAVLFLLGTTVLAVDTKSEMKIAVIDLQKVMMNCPQLEAAKTSLKSKFDKREKELVNAQQDFQKAIEALNKNGPTMKEDEKKAAQQKIMDQQKKLQEMQSKFQSDLNTAQNEAMQNIIKKIEGIVKDVAKARGLRMIFAKAAVAYNEPESDLTGEAVKLMNKK